MHVIDHREINKRKELKHKRKHIKSFIRTVAILLVVATAGLYFIFSLKDKESASSPKVSEVAEKIIAEPSVPVKTKSKLKNFTGAQFRDLYRSINYPNTQQFHTPPEITGNIEADNRIRSLAEKRGFVITAIPVAPIDKTNEPRLQGDADDLLQPLALKSWQELKNASKKDGLNMTITSAYRSPKWQRELFTQRLFSTGVTIEQIVAGKADNYVNSTLSLTAVPGFSRHHTGYTVDLHCEDGLAFGNSSCNKWLIANNYANAKKFGWIPSYPPDAGEQGPEPEPWEYVWVGTDVLYE